MSADDRSWLPEMFPELEATLAHLDRCDNQIALLTDGTGTEDRGARFGRLAQRSANLCLVGSHQNGRSGRVARVARRGMGLGASPRWR
jgi:hypothetical protein